MDNPTVSQKKYITIAVVGIFIILGIAVPRWLISDGVQSLSGEQKSFAEYAVLRAETENFENPLLGLVIQKIRVQGVRKVTGSASCMIYDAAGKDIALTSSYEADVSALTFFGIPVASAHITCNE